MRELNQSILEALQQLPFLGESIAVKPLQQQGLSNSAYQLIYEGKLYFLKVLDSNHFIQLARKQLFELQGVLADKSFAPEAIYLDPQERFQIDAWVDGKTLSEATLTTTDKLATLAVTMAAIHTVEVTIPELNLRADWFTYYNKIGTDLDEEIYERINRYETRYQATNEKVLCHNDLALAHCHANNPKLAYDWEYAAIGNRFYDLASCIDVNQLDNRDTEFFLDAYWAETQQALSFLSCSKAQLKDNVAAMKELVLYTNDLWFEASRC
ncbi:hypothetical protein EYS14_09500 [Alteromonadaceae bacterium M269]|nr:hypothetical protein EYS14_09500 [Alteromonadaceae bacterium M269]